MGGGVFEAGLAGGGCCVAAAEGDEVDGAGGLAEGEVVEAGGVGEGGESGEEGVEVGLVWGVGCVVSEIVCAEVVEVGLGGCESGEGMEEEEEDGGGEEGVMGW